MSSQVGSDSGHGARTQRILFQMHRWPRLQPGRQTGLQLRRQPVSQHFWPFGQALSLEHKSSESAAHRITVLSTKGHVPGVGTGEHGNRSQMAGHGSFRSQHLLHVSSIRAWPPTEIIGLGQSGQYTIDV